MPPCLRAKILVLSDSAAAGERADLSGPAVRDVLQARGWQVVVLETLPDDADGIRRCLEAWSDGEDCDAVFTTGGTGLGPRDVTPEATRGIIEREGVKKNRRAALSRGLAGVRRGKLIVNLPGSVKGAGESLAAIVDLLPHAVDLVQGRTEHGD
jgi:molybdopterin adenylyltransferase